MAWLSTQTVVKVNLSISILPTYTVYVLDSGRVCSWTGAIVVMALLILIVSCLVELKINQFQFIFHVLSFVVRVKVHFK